MRRFPILLGLLVLAISGASIDANEGRRSGTPIHGVQFTQKGYIQVRINVLNAFDRLMCLLLPAPSPPPSLRSRERTGDGKSPAFGQPRDCVARGFRCVIRAVPGERQPVKSGYDKMIIALGKRV